jgi:hypothetical protein
LVTRSTVEQQGAKCFAPWISPTPVRNIHVADGRSGQAVHGFPLTCKDGTHTVIWNSKESPIGGCTPWGRGEINLGADFMRKGTPIGKRGTALGPADVLHDWEFEQTTTTTKIRCRSRETADRRLIKRTIWTGVASLVAAAVKIFIHWCTSR